LERIGIPIDTALHVEYLKNGDLGEAPVTSMCVPFLRSSVMSITGQRT
jgi:hypothetical protein